MLREILQSIVDDGFAPYVKEYELLKKHKNSAVYFELVRAYLEAGFSWSKATTLTSLGISKGTVVHHVTQMKDVMGFHDDPSPEFWICLYVCHEMETITKKDSSEKVSVELGGMVIHLTMQRD